MCSCDLLISACKGFPLLTLCTDIFFGEIGCWTKLLYKLCPLCPYGSKKTNINTPKTFTGYFSIWQLLELERRLLSKLPHIQFPLWEFSIPKTFSVKFAT